MSVPIFFQPVNEKDYFRRSTKIDIIKDIFLAWEKIGKLASGSDFNYFYDLDMDELYLEQVKQKDKVFAVLN